MQKKINLSKTARKTPISANMQALGTSIRDENLPMPKYDEVSHSPAPVSVATLHHYSHHTACKPHMHALQLRTTTPTQTLQGRTSVCAAVELRVAVWAMCSQPACSDKQCTVAGAAQHA
jgi:hypothetical protein